MLQIKAVEALIFKPVNAMR